MAFGQDVLLSIPVTAMVSREVKVGAFVLLSLFILGALVFMIGDERRLFQRHTPMRAAFTDVQGLSRGSPVRMGGLDIGRVVGMEYDADPKKDTIYVDMLVVEEEGVRVRQDSIARVEGKGLLGDKMIVITVGSPSSPPIREGQLVRTEESRDIAEIINDLKGAAAGAERVIANLEKTTEEFSDEAFTGDVKETVAHLSEILEAANKGDGYVGRLLHDPNEANNISTTVASFRKSADELERLLASTRAVVERVRTGPGFAHGVIYEEDGSKALSQIGGAADEVALALRGVRQGDSFAHDLLFEQKTSELSDNLNKASADLAALTADLRAGKGTLGALLSDPSVYDDIKVLLGNVGRNRSLRALVRYSIAEDEKSGRVVDSSGQDPAKDELSAGASASATVP